MKNGLTTWFLGISAAMALAALVAVIGLLGVHQPEAAHAQDDDAPSVTGLEIISVPGKSTYRPYDDVEISMTFSEPVVVEGDVMLNLRVGDEAGNWRGAPYVSGSGTDTLKFVYTAQVGDSDTDGISIDGSWVDDDGVRHGYSGSGTISANGSAFTPRYGGLADDPGHMVDGIAPTITSVSIRSDPGSDGTYETGDTIEVGVTFDEDVFIMASLSLDLDFDGTTKTAVYRNPWFFGSSLEFGDALVFSYTVQEDDADADGIAIGADAFGEYDHFWIEDDHQNKADLSHDAVPADSGHRVNTPGGL